MIPDGWDTRKFIESWMIFSHNDLWYVPAYMILYALSPMLNAGTERLTTGVSGSGSECWSP